VRGSVDPEVACPGVWWVRGAHDPSRGTIVARNQHRRARILDLRPDAVQRGPLPIPDHLCRLPALA